MGSMYRSLLLLLFHFIPPNPPTPCGVVSLCFGDLRPLHFLVLSAAKLVPVGYGIKKLQIMLTIVDDLVSVDDLIEEELTVEPCSEYVQSCDIVAFNKI